jgi:hypothetical protein
MPSLSQISNNFFLNLINRLGVRPPPPESFLLSNVVQPVTIVDSDISLPAILTTQTLDTASSTGPQAAPAAGTLLADTGALSAGIFSFFVSIGINAGANQCDFILGRRNAANAAYVWRQQGCVSPTGIGFITFSFTAKMLASERLRIEELAAGGALTSVEANIFASQIS